MAKKNSIDLKDYIPAKEAADILTRSHGRKIDPSRINKLKNVRRHKINASTFVYHRDDVETCRIRQRRALT